MKRNIRNLFRLRPVYWTHTSNGVTRKLCCFVDKEDPVYKAVKHLNGDYLKRDIYGACKKYFEPIKIASLTVFIAFAYVVCAAGALILLTRLFQSFLFLGGLL